VPKNRVNPGKRLRAIRWAHGLSLRDVHHTSLKLARRLRNKKFVLPPSRLHHIERKDSIPSIHRLYTLAYIYGWEMRELARWYGVPRSL